MAKALTLFKDFDKNSVGRFYHLDFYYFLLYIVSNGAKTIDDIFSYSIINKSELIEIETMLNSKEKFNTETQIRSTIKECILFGFIKTEDQSTILLTDEGHNILNLLKDRKHYEIERIICQKMEEYYGKLSQFVNMLRSSNTKNGLVVFPKPTPKELDCNSKQILEDPNSLKKYCTSFADYAFKDIKKYMDIEINKSEVTKILFKELTEYFIKQKYDFKNVNVPRQVKRIMYNYYLNIFFENKFDINSFDLWLRRARELKLVNFSEFYPGIHSTIIYPVSLVLARIPNNSSFINMAKTRNREYLLRYEPLWDEDFKEVFLQALWTNYVELSRVSKNFFISLHDLKDVVCYSLQISEYSFTNFIGKSYNESINETIKKFKISLEVDRSPEDRKLVNSKRYPILINSIPKNIIGIKMR